MGEILYQKAHEEDVFTVTLQKEEVETVREKMPFWRDADPFMIMQ
jgi:predicted amidohydrolase